LLAAAALLVARGAAWKGADQRTVEVIGEVRGDYQPWFRPFFTPGRAERYLFGLQAALGTAALTGLAGWAAGRRESTDQQTLRAAGVVAACSLVAGAGLAFVSSEHGEIQALISAAQGVCLGLPAFLIGYLLGRRAAAVAGHAKGAS